MNRTHGRTPKRVGAALVALLVATPVVLLTGTTAGATEASEPDVTSLIVRYAPGTPVTEGADAATGDLLAEGVDLSPGEAIGFGLRTVELSKAMSTGEAEKLAEVLEADPAIITAEPNYRVTVADTPEPTVENVKPAEGTHVWGLDRIDQRSTTLDGNYTYRHAGAGVDVYVVDTGVFNHVELTGRIKAGQNFAPDTYPAEYWLPNWSGTLVVEPTATTDLNGHGTHVAGTIAGSWVGVAQSASIIPVRVLDSKGDGETSTVIAAMNWVVSHHTAGQPAVVNLSLGGPANAPLNEAVQRVIDDGVTVVVASGNENADSCNYSPANLPAAITVNSSTSLDVRADTSNYGARSDIYAPGEGILSAANQTGLYAVASGTSMAAPHVAGVAARVLSSRPTLTPAQVWGVIAADATPVTFSPGGGDPDRLLYSGTGQFTFTQVSPATGTISGGEAITLTGTGFTANTQVSFGATPAAVTSRSSTSLTVVAPATATAGTVSVSVTDSGVELAAAALSSAYTYTALITTPAPSGGTIPAPSAPATGGGGGGGGAPAGGSVPATRTSGPDRFATAAAVSQQAFPDGNVPVVYVAAGAGFADALSASAAAAAAGGPVLLVNKTNIPAAIAAELERLNPQRIIVQAGPASVSESVVNQLRNYTSGPVTVNAGMDRYDTAIKTAQSFTATGETVILATGADYPDALSAASLYSNYPGPVLLIKPSEGLSTAVAAEIRRLAPARVLILGGTATLSVQVEADVAALGVSVIRLAGADRYATSAAIAAWVNDNGGYGSEVIAASGRNFPDALAAGPLARTQNSALLLTNGTCWSAPASALVSQLAPASLRLLGGEGAQAPSVSQMASCG